MKILAIERDIHGVTEQDFKPLLCQEAARVWELHQSGVIRELYFRDDQTSAVLVLECSNSDEADQILQTLPLVNEGLITFEIIPLRAYPGFSRLFAE